MDLVNVQLVALELNLKTGFSQIVRHTQGSK